MKSSSSSRAPGKLVSAIVASLMLCDHTRSTIASETTTTGSDRCAFPSFVKPVVRAQWWTCRCMAITAVGQRSGVVTVGCACTGGTSSSRCRWPLQQPFITAVMLGPCRTTILSCCCCRRFWSTSSGLWSRTLTSQLWVVVELVDVFPVSPRTELFYDCRADR